MNTALNVATSAHAPIPKVDLETGITHSLNVRDEARRSGSLGTADEIGSLRRFRHDDDTGLLFIEPQAQLGRGYHLAFARHVTMHEAKS